MLVIYIPQVSHLKDYRLPNSLYGKDGIIVKVTRRALSRQIVKPHKKTIIHLSGRFFPSLISIRSTRTEPMVCNVITEADAPLGKRLPVPA